MKSNIALLAIINKGFSIHSRGSMQKKTGTVSGSKQTNK